MKIDEKQFGFQSGKSMVNAMFLLQQLQEKFGPKKKELFLVFVDLEKAFVVYLGKQFDETSKSIWASHSTCYGHMYQYKVMGQDSSRYFK